MYTVIGKPGWGSAIVEAALVQAGQPYRTEDVDPTQPGPARDRLLALNPLGQVPTVLMPDGSVMTESAAIVLHLADVAPGCGLAPAADDPLRPAFLRWLVFLVAAIYPTFTYGDDPGRWVDGEAAAKSLRAHTDAHREASWRQVEAAAAMPWFLGAQFSALDIYIGVMTRWRPRRDWFAAQCPKLTAIAAAAERRPDLAPAWRRNVV
ncbi:MAG: glutathione S-transferase family protein [Alphaproteobacteria bacterium]|nr:glutathione S-transferase family protein [Alphaproteobacteria bacterium]